MYKLSVMNCVPVRSGEKLLSEAEIVELHGYVPDWTILELDGIQRLQRSYKFKNFIRALEFTNRVGEIAEQQDHHPALLTEWGKVTVTWWTHVVKGLHRNDFVMASKTDDLYSE